MKTLLPLTPFCVGIFLILFALQAGAQDRIRLLSGSVSGEITQTTRLEVTIEKKGEETVVPITRIRSLLFGGEPSVLSQARVNIENGGYKTAQKKLASISKESLKKRLVRQDVAYYQALCLAKLAIAGESDPAEAGRALRAFAREHGDSYHYYGAVRTMGDLLVAIDRPDDAIKLYGRLTSTPYVSMQVRGEMLSGRALQAAGRHAEAIARFDVALRLKSDELTGDVAERTGRQQLAAQLGKAESLAITGEIDSALELTSEVLRKCDRGATTLLAAAYNTRGRCYEESGRSTDAMLAYLHTDLLFSSDTATHAEALHHLAALWKKAGKREEAKEANNELQRRYGNTKKRGP